MEFAIPMMLCIISFISSDYAREKKSKKKGGKEEYKISRTQNSGIDVGINPFAMVLSELKVFPLHSEERILFGKNISLLHIINYDIMNVIRNAHVYLQRVIFMRDKIISCYFLQYFIHHEEAFV